MTSTTLTVRLAPEVKERLGHLADSTRRTKSFLAAEAIERYVQRELEIIESIERARADVRAGRVVPHADVQSEVAEMIARGRRQAEGE